MMTTLRSMSVVGTLGLFGLIVSTFPQAAGQAVTNSSIPQVIEFNRDVRPILSDKCYTCHGPDAANRRTRLRFDTEDGAKQDLGGGRLAIAPADPERSELVQRITSDDPIRRMPPAYMGGEKLTEREIDLLTRWVEQGAQWQKHWSFIPPKRRSLPDAKNAAWPRSGLDHFVLERLGREGLQASPEAGRAALLRRVTLDLTGLPPTKAEIDAFLNDPSPDAYERVVDRLLQSPRFGERMAFTWLDAARYADTNGYQSDGEREMWRWRDWVIDAFNKNMPFDEFTVEQIAGDLLPHPTLDQKIATGFNRNHRLNGEGGIVPEEYAAEYVMDRVDTTSTVFLGLTLGCARCHDHKYDPLSQKEFYQVFAYFNNVPEHGKAFKFGNSPPQIAAPTPTQQRTLNDLDAKLTVAERKFTKLIPRVSSAQSIWEQSLVGSRQIDWSVSKGLLAHYTLNMHLSDSAPSVGDATTALARWESRRTMAAGDLRGRILGRQQDSRGTDRLPEWKGGEPNYIRGKLGEGARFDGQQFIELGDFGGFDFADKFSLAAWVYPTASDGTIIAKAEQTPEGGRGYGIYLYNQKVQLNLVQRLLDDSLRVETEEPIQLNQWQHILVTYDGTRSAGSVHIYIDGKSRKLRLLLDQLGSGFRSTAPLRIGASDGVAPAFQGYIDDVRIYDTLLSADQVAVIAVPSTVSEIARIPASQRTDAEALKMKLCFVSEYAPEPLREAWLKLEDFRFEKERFIDSVPNVMVMEERATPPKAHLLIRGAYDRPGEQVEPGVPTVLPGLPQKASNNRLGFAKWLVDPSNPLTARVTVNRFWQMFFGVGLVKTVEDFGSQGEWPTHADLLDWLATQFIDSGWDVKSIVRTIVTSATYRQSSRASEELLQKDPENRLLARGPRFRLPAEVVRDQALAISGLLVEKLGGPSVKPYQPAGLWKEMQGESDYPQDHGEKLYRRSLYTYWKRSVPPPFMMTFDSAGREACTVRATRTNTPLQALNLMNDVTYVEAARKTAERMMLEGGQAPTERIAFGFRLATARQPNEREREVLLNSFHRYLDEYQTSRDAALQLLSEGESPRNESLDVSELASYTAVASLIFNLDETVTKE